jgi:TldD protein
MLDHELARSVVDKAMRPGDHFGDLFAEHFTHVVFQVRNGEVIKARHRTEHGVGLRRTGDTYSQHVHTCDLSEEGLFSLVAALQEGGRPKRSIPGGISEQPDILPLDDMIGVAREAANEARLRSASPQAEITAQIVATRRSILIGRSDGKVLEEIRYQCALHVDVVVRKGNKVRHCQRSVGARMVSDLRIAEQHLATAREAAIAAPYRLEAISAPSGELTVILAPGGPATLLHEACGHPLEADLAHHPASAYHGCLGTRVAAPMVTLIDDPRASASAPMYHVDDEGESAEATVLIEKGILRNYMFDRRTAHVEGHASNGHGRRLSYAYPPLPRMSTTYIASGESSPADIIAETKKGILVQSIRGGDTDMGSGRFNLEVGEGWLVENGRVTAPIRGAVLSGRGPDVLRAIDRVGNDCQFLHFYYLCNKLDQFPLVVSVGQPTLRISKMLVWGG